MFCCLVTWWFCCYAFPCDELIHFTNSHIFDEAQPPRSGCWLIKKTYNQINLKSLVQLLHVCLYPQRSIIRRFAKVNNFDALAASNHIFSMVESTISARSLPWWGGPINIYGGCQICSCILTYYIHHKY